MKPIKLKIKTKSENYPIIIGSNLIKNLNFSFKKIQLFLINVFW